MEAIAAASWIIVHSKPCPNDDVARSTDPIVSAVYRIPAASPGRSIPVRYPKLKRLSYLQKTSTPRRLAIFMSPSLQDNARTSCRLSSPCPVSSAHLIRVPETISLPSQKNVSFPFRMPLSRAAPIVIGLKVEPGSYTSEMQ